ncbi:MAG TPA: hypothetical protein VJV79_05630 [Polyangiaceae bacterium]|nr:hypothetical protein [Polyangiaceae bacterium]
MPSAKGRALAAHGRGRRRRTRISLSAHSTSADTLLAWRVELTSQTIKVGTVTWSPVPLDDAVEEHAVTLLRVAEAGLVLDCPDVAPPASLTHSAPALAASALDVDSQSLRKAAKAISDDWRKVTERQRVCAQASSRTLQPSAQR